MKVIISGSRDIENYHLVEVATKRSNFDITTVLSGGARGVDRLGLAYALNHRIPSQIFLPKWNQLGKRAGMVRNQEMAMVADAVIAVWDGKSTGTWNMIQIASAFHLPCFVLTINTSKPFDLKGVTFSRL